MNAIGKVLFICCQSLSAWPPFSLAMGARNPYLVSCSLKEIQNLVPELVCLVIRFRILIILKVSSFLIFKSVFFSQAGGWKGHWGGVTGEVVKRGVGRA